MKRLFARQIFRPGIKITVLPLFLIFSLSIILVFVNQYFVKKVPRTEYLQMVSAAEIMNRAIREISSYKKYKNIQMDRTIDPYSNGFIGIEFSPITTTLGNLEAKQTSTNPDFAALIVYWLDQLKLSQEQKAIIHASGSFPALSIAAIIACETVGIEPIICSSGGASSFGANIPQLTYWDMENYLWKKRIIKHRTQYATPGGNQDNGSSFWEGGMEIIKEAAHRNNYELIILNSLEDAIEQKWNFLQKLKPVGVFINVGGNQAAMGNNNCSLSIPNGLILIPLNCSASNKGLIHLFNQENIPVIHFLNIRDIALQKGIALTSSTLPKPGQSSLYYTEKKPAWLPIISFALIFVLLIYFREKESD
jgi:poly-gamma-glutamate system protein